MNDNGKPSQPQQQQDGGCPTSEFEQTRSGDDRQHREHPTSPSLPSAASQEDMERSASVDASELQRQEGRKRTDATSSPLMALESESPQRIAPSRSQKQSRYSQPNARSAPSSSAASAALPPRTPPSSSRRQQQPQPTHAQQQQPTNEDEDPRIAAAELSTRLEAASTELVDNLYRFVNACRQNTAADAERETVERSRASSRSSGGGTLFQRRTRDEAGSNDDAHNNTNGQKERKGKKKRKKMGLSLPASAIGWLSSRMDPQAGDEYGEYRYMYVQQSRRAAGGSGGGREGGNSHRSSGDGIRRSRPSSNAPMQLSERLALLRFHLPQYVEHLRITNEEWPPPPPPSSGSGDGGAAFASNRRRWSGGIDSSVGSHGTSRSSGGLTSKISSPIGGVITKETPSPARNRSVLSRYYQDASTATSSSRTRKAEHNEEAWHNLEENLVAKYARSSQKQAAIRFLFYWHKLQYRPRVDMALFANVKVLVVDGVLPECIVNMELVQNTLDNMKVERSCLYDVSTFFFSRDRDSQSSQSVKESDVADAGEIASERLASAPNGKYGNHNGFVTDELSPSSHVTNLNLQRFDENVVETGPPVNRVRDDDKGYYAKLAHLRLSYCGIGEGSGLYGDNVETGSMLRPFDRMPNLESLNLSHNELVRATTACAGLKGLPRLSALDLSFNRLQNMSNAFLMLGNVKTLVLSSNQLSSVGGLERLYSLERLSLDYNNIKYLQDVAGLAALPELMRLELKGNPIETLDARCRVNILNVFKERRISLLPRGATFRQLQEILPTIDGQAATSDELLSLKEMTFAPLAVSSTPMYLEKSAAALTSSTERAQLPSHEEFPAFSPLTSQYASTTLNSAPRRTKRCVQRRQANIRTLDFSSGVSESSFIRDRSSRVSAVDRKKQMKIPALPNGSCASNLFAVEDVISALVPRATSIAEGSTDSEEQGAFVDAESSEDDIESSFNSEEYCDDDDKESFSSALSHAIEEAALDSSMVEVKSSQSVPPETITPKGEKTCETSDKSTGTSSSAGGEKEVPVDDEKASPPVDETEARSDVLKGSAPSSNNQATTSSVDDQRVIAATDSGFKEKRQNDFGAAEKDAVYDGSESYSKFPVAAYLQLYFRLYVFPSATSEGNRFYEEFDDDAEVDDYERLPAKFPRIQLFRSDRELAVRAPIGDKYGIRAPIKERFVDVWRDEVMACGIASTSRLPPVAKVLRGFHGDIVRNRGIEELVCDSQQIQVCLSDAALYFIADVSINKDEGSERRFPAAIPRRALFKDAFWPHAFARHPLEFLQRITIGFQFQRLVLHFVLPKRNHQTKELEYAYVLFTCNKLRTISLVQKLQAQKKALEVGFTSASATDEDLIIDNDDRVVLDSLADAISPTSMGAVLHYQVLRQKWKHQRLDGTDPEVRRVCVLTDSNIFLLNESYVGDGSSLTMTHKGKYGDAVLSLVDGAELSQVSEIRAADEDPRHITLVIQAKSRLMRSHRWRLVCKDGESAERLIDDVRRSVAAL